MDDNVIPPKRKAGGRPFPKGKSGNPGGKPKGTEALRKVAIREFGEALMRDIGTELRPLKGKGDRYTLKELLAQKPYLEGVIFRIKTGKADHLEKFIWEHMFGKPKVTVEEVKRPPESPLAAAMKERKPEEIRALAAAAHRVIEARANIPDRDHVGRLDPDLEPPPRAPLRCPVRAAAAPGQVCGLDRFDLDHARGGRRLAAALAGDLERG